MQSSYLASSTGTAGYAGSCFSTVHQGRLPGLDELTHHTGNENSLCGFPITGSIDILSLVHRPHGSYHTLPGFTPCWKPTRWICSPYTGFSHLVGDPFLPTQGGKHYVKMVPQGKFSLWALQLWVNTVMATVIKIR